MPQSTEVQGWRTPGSRDVMVEPTPQELLIEAYRSERAGYERLLDAGITERGGHSVVKVIADIDKQILYYGGTVVADDGATPTPMPFPMTGEATKKVEVPADEPDEVPTSIVPRSRRKA